QIVGVVSEMVELARTGWPPRGPVHGPDELDVGRPLKRVDGRVVQVANSVAQPGRDTPVSDVAPVHAGRRSELGHGRVDLVYDKAHVKESAGLRAARLLLLHERVPPIPHDAWPQPCSTIVMLNAACRQVQASRVLVRFIPTRASPPRPRVRGAVGR